MDVGESRKFRWVSQPRPAREHRRFVMGKGKFVADISLPGMKHVGLVTSPYPHARIRAIHTEKALALSGVHAVVTGEEMARDTEPLLQYLDLPHVQWRPLANREVNYVGEWVVAVVADTRAIAEDAAELVEVEYEPLPHVIDPEEALREDAPLVHHDHGTNVVYRRRFVWGDVERHFQEADATLSFRVRWNRSATVPLETFGVVCRWDPGLEILDVWASIQMPQYAEQIASALRLPLNCVRVHYDVDVGGSYGVKRGIKHTVLAGYLSRRLGVPVRLIEDRLENMRGGDAHGPDRIFDVSVAFQRDGRIRSLKLRTVDDEGAFPGRSPLQLGKPVGAIVGPYTIESAEYEAIAVVTNKTSQVAVRGFGQAPTNYAIEAAVDEVARYLGMDPIEVRRRNLIPKDQFPYTIPSGTTYDSGDYHTVLDKALQVARYPEMCQRRDALRQRGYLAGIGVATCLEPSGGNAIFEPLLNPRNQSTAFLEGCQIKVDRHGQITAAIGFSSAGQGHETMVATLVAEELGCDPDAVRVIRSDSLAALPSQSPVASRMAIMLGGAVAGAARKLKEKLIRIAAYNLRVPPDQLEYRDQEVFVRYNPSIKMTWNELVLIAHRQFHRMPVDMEPGLHVHYVLQVPTGGRLPTEDGRVHMYPCYSFTAHIALVSIDPETCKLTIEDYALAHDCGTVINPSIVRGMVLGGVAHGIGAALYEQFVHDQSGQLLTQTFMDYIMPSIKDVPDIRMAEHCTPSPITSLGQKGIGEGGYMAAPAAIANAINDALVPIGARCYRLPARLRDLWEVISQARTRASVGA